MAKDLHGPRGHKAPDERLFTGCHCPCCPRDHEHGPWFICASMSGPQNQRVVLAGGSPLIGSRGDILFPTASSVSLVPSKLLCIKSKICHFLTGTTKSNYVPLFNFKPPFVSQRAAGPYVMMEIARCFRRGLRGALTLFGKRRQS